MAQVDGEVSSRIGKALVLAHEAAYLGVELPKPLLLSLVERHGW
jgi:hypothetical protein